MQFRFGRDRGAGAMADNQVSALLGTALKYVGYLEKASDRQLEDKIADAGSGNYTVFGQWYHMNGQPWCAMFVSYCADKAGIETDVIPKHASCAVGVSWFKNTERWHARDGYIPLPGDVIYFTQDGRTPAHVGIVVKSEKGRVYTVEGNTSSGSTLIANGGAVAEKSYPLSYVHILGYGNPAYKEEKETVEDIKKAVATAEGTGTVHSAWADEAVSLFTSTGIVSGDGRGNYGWGQCLTKEGAAQILYNLLDRLDLLEVLKKGDKT